MVYILMLAGAFVATGFYACCVAAKNADNQMRKMWENREQLKWEENLDRSSVENMPHWTLASDGEPTEDGDYLVVDPECCYYIATYYTTDGTEEYGWKQFRGWQDCPRVIAWMPIPAFHGFSEEVESE